jgi:hypothetical protein
MTRGQAANLARVRQQNPAWRIEAEDGRYVARRSWSGREQAERGTLADIELKLRSQRGGPRRKAVTGQGPASTSRRRAAKSSRRLRRVA